MIFFIIHDQHSLYGIDAETQQVFRVPDFSLDGKTQLSATALGETIHLPLFKDSHDLYSFDVRSFTVERLENVDIATLRFDALRFVFKDRHRLYALNENTFELIPLVGLSVDAELLDMAAYGPVLKDETQVAFILPSGVAVILKDKNPVDLTTFSLLPGWSSGDFLFRDQNHVYYLDTLGALTVLEQFDAATFSFTQNNGFAYGKDKNGFYHYYNQTWDRLEGADPNTLTIRTGVNGNYYYYLSDDDQVWSYYAGDDAIKLLAGDPDTFDFDTPPEQF
ncbi:DKNYY domain-containing protein [Candidatus Peregrinibacteria bacterium]|nr:MAG: DKNYY domain-containing protein [Candidatus Peregrinibacteria bacterium]